MVQRFVTSSLLVLGVSSPKQTWKLTWFDGSLSLRTVGVVAFVVLPCCLAGADAR